MSRNEDWSEYTQSETVELAGKWKHGWIPLDATAVSSKMKGNTGGKKWWGGDKRRQVRGISKPEGQTVGKKRIQQSREVKPGDIGKAERQNERNRLQRNQNQVAGNNRGDRPTRVLNVGQVPGAKAQKRGDSKGIYPGGKIESMKRPTANGKPIDVAQYRLDGAGNAKRTLGSQADTLAENYVRMHGTDGAREKLAQLRARKIKDPRAKELIAALERLVGSGGSPRVGNRKAGGPGKA